MVGENQTTVKKENYYDGMIHGIGAGILLTVVTLWIIEKDKKKK